MHIIARPPLLAVYLLLLPCFLFARTGGGKQVTITDSASAAASPDVALHSRICTCQIMNMQSANYQHVNVAVFAEKSRSPDLKKDLRINTRVIEKEKKHLKDFFYQRLSVVNQVTAPTDCKSLYNRLRFYNRSLVLYDILDADVR